FDTSPFGPDVGLARHRRDQPPHLVSPQSRGAISHGPPPCPRLLGGGKKGEKHPPLPRSDQNNWPKPQPCHQTEPRRKIGRHTTSPHSLRLNRTPAEHSSASWK